MKKLILYPGCIMPTEQYSYELSIRETLPKLGVNLVDIEGFSCCGEPLKSVNQMLTLFLSARNLAIADKNNLDLFVPCPMCHLALSECKRILNSDRKIMERINDFLLDEDLKYEGKQEIIHTIDLIHDHLGIDIIKKHLKKSLKDLKIATHYGCHLIRPNEIGRPVDSENPQKMENILKTLGANPVYYPQKLDCCGAPILAHLPESALTKTGQKLQAIQDQGFDALVTVCPWCQKMFDARQQKAGEIIAATLNIPVFYLPQLLGLALGIDEKKLGLDLNQSSVNSLELGVL